MAALGLGVGLALLSIHVALPTGWIGGLALIGWTLFARRRWTRLQQTTKLEPGGSEQILRFYAVGTGLLFGHSITAFAFPESDIHVGTGNYLAIDSWTMIIAMIISSFFIRQDKKIQDERDAVISANGTKSGYMALISILILFSFSLGFVPPRFVPTLTFFMVANAQITIILASLLVKYTVQLFGYAKDTNAAFATGSYE